MSDAVDPVTSDAQSLEEEKKPTKTAVVGKVVTFVNFTLAIVFLSIAFFFHANRIEVSEKKNELLQTTRQLTELETARQLVVDDLTQQIQAEEQRLADVKQRGEKEVQGLETEADAIRKRVEDSKVEQDKFSKQAAEAQEKQKQLVDAIQNLRVVREDTRGEEEALAAERKFLLDQLAKTTNNLKQAIARAQEVEETISELQRSAGQ